MIPKILRWWVNSVPRRVCAWLEVCVCNMMKREEEEQGVSWDAWVGVDEVEHRSLRLCRLPPPISVFHSFLLLSLLLPSAVRLHVLVKWFQSVPLRRGKTGKRKWHLFESIVRRERQRQCLCACLEGLTLSDTSKSKDEAKKRKRKEIAARPLR